MFKNRRVLGLAAVLAVATTGLAACSSSGGKQATQSATANGAGKVAFWLTTFGLASICAA